MYTYKSYIYFKNNFKICGYYVKFVSSACLTS